MGKRSFSLRAILLLVLSTLILLIVVMSARTTLIQWKELGRIQELKVARDISQKMFAVAENLANERDLTIISLRALDAKEIPDLADRLAASRRETDAAWEDVSSPLQAYAFEGFSTALNGVRDKFQSMANLRKAVDAELVLAAAQRNKTFAVETFDALTRHVTQTQDLWMEFTRHFTTIDPVVTQRVMFNHLLGMNLEYISRERALISGIIVAEDKASTEDQAQLLRWQGAIRLGWRTLGKLAERAELSPKAISYLKDAESHYTSIHDMVDDIFYVPGADFGSVYPISADLWFEVAVQVTESVTTLKNAALNETREYVIKLEKDKKDEIFLLLAFLLLATLLCVYSYYIVLRRVVGPIHLMVKALEDTAHGVEGAPVSAFTNYGDEIGRLADVLHLLQRNMEDLRRTSAMLERYTQDLERSNKELDDFAYIASHDLKEPLRGIHNHSCFLLEDNQSKLDPDSVSRLNRLIHLSKRMEKLVNDLLYFSRLGRQALAVQETDLNEVIVDIKDTTETFLEERRAKIVLPARLPTLVCDKPRVAELFRNLITNAAKYNDQSERLIEVGFLPNKAMPDGTVMEGVLYVKDNGRGIAPEFHTEIFRIFRRLQSNAPGEEGTGVGLTFVKKIVERHGGKIWLESQVGAGTTFYFTLKGARE